MTVISLGVVALCGEPASGETTYRSTVSPSTIDFPRTRSLTCRLEVATGEQAERLRLDIAGSPYGRGEPEGSPVDPGEPKLEGPGRLVEESVLSVDYAPGACFRGYMPSELPRYRLEVPPRSRSAVVVRAAVSRTPPWPETDYRLFTIDRRLKVRSPRPRSAGSRGVRIRLWTRPRTASFFDFAYFGKGRVLGRMRELSIRGKTDPNVSGQLVGLRVVYARRGELQQFTPERSRLLGRVRVDRRGRFKYRWRPALAGRYQLYATYARQRKRLTNDSSCPLGFDVR